MRSRIEVRKAIILELNEKEATWLRAICQNPLHDEEDETDEEMRQLFFNMLPVLF